MKCGYCGEKRRLVRVARGRAGSLIAYEEATAYMCDYTKWYQLGHTKFIFTAQKTKRRRKK